MSVQESGPMKKAETHSFALPKIGKLKGRYNSYHTSRQSQYHNKSLFLERV